MQKHEYTQRLASGLVSSTFRKFFSQIILTGSNIILARILLPSVWGTFSIISFIVVGIGTLMGFGLSQAIVQRKAPPSSETLKTVFTTYVLSASLFALLLYFLAPLINHIYHDALF